MQVDSENIQQLLPEILSHIERAHFISFDCEFSGLVTQLQRMEGTFSNHVEFYERIKETAYNFRIIQLGIATFEFVDGLYIPQVYNFYVSPLTFTSGFNNVMVCEVDSMQFLANNNLDFSRVFKKGIKSGRIYSHDELPTHEYNNFSSFNYDDMFFGPEDEEDVKIIQSLLDPLVEDNSKERIVNFKSKPLFNFFKQKYPLMLFDKPKKHMQPVQYNVRIRDHGEKQEEKMKETQPEVLTTKMNHGEMTEVKSECEEKASLKQVISAIIQGGKPLVGHFPNLDIGLIFQTFLKDLPESYHEFCSQINYVFPWIFDTKVLSRRLQSSLKGLKVDLSSLFKACSNPKLLRPYSNFSTKGLEQYVAKEHEAGYDAFITGCAFIGMANFLSGEVGKINFEGKSLERENKLFYSRFSGEVSINGDGYCSNALNYDNTILIQSVSKKEYLEWKTAAQALSKFGTLTVHEDHGEIYYAFERPQKLAQIVYLLPGFHFQRYQNRRYPKARNMYL